MVINDTCRVDNLSNNGIALCEIFNDRLGKLMHVACDTARASSISSQELRNVVVFNLIGAACFHMHEHASLEDFLQFVREVYLDTKRARDNAEVDYGYPN